MPAGGFVTAAGVGVLPVDDPFDRAVRVYHVPYTNGAFRPFTLDPGQSAAVGGHLTMCPTAPPQAGISYGYDRIRITYSYGGWSRTDEVPMAGRLSIDNAGTCDGSGITR